MSLMLFIALVLIVVILFLIHTTRLQLIRMLRHGDIDGALRVLEMFDQRD